MEEGRTEVANAASIEAREDEGTAKGNTSDDHTEGWDDTANDVKEKVQSAGIDDITKEDGAKRNEYHAKKTEEIRSDLKLKKENSIAKFYMKFHSKNMGKESYPGQYTGPCQTLV